MTSSKADWSETGENGILKTIDSRLFNFGMDVSQPWEGT